MMILAAPEFAIHSEARGLNNEGIVVGSVHIRNGSIDYDVACEWVDGAWQSLNVMGVACDVNSSGKVVGSSAAHAFYYDGYMSQARYGYDNSVACGALAINDAGSSAGWSVNPANGRSHTVTWNVSGSMREVDNRMGQTRDLNDSGEFVGYSYDYYHPRNTAVHWQQGPSGWSESWYNPMQGAEECYANSINSAGVTAGCSGRVAVVWTSVGSSPVSLSGDLPQTQRAAAVKIKDLGQVVGYNYDGVEHAWTWDALQGVTLLPDYGYGSFAYSVNNNGSLGEGLICGYAYDSTGTPYAVVWSMEVPEPTALIALLCGIGGLGGIKWRNRK